MKYIRLLSTRLFCCSLACLFVILLFDGSVGRYLNTNLLCFLKTCGICSIHQVVIHVLVLRGRMEES